ncbi:hypothetical protein ACROYT_G022850 [Oculina patagonica]
MQSQEFSYFLSRENDLESVEEEYFNPRPAEEQGDEDEVCSDYSSDEYEFDHDTDSDIESFEFSEFDTSERLKVEAFVSKTCGCTLGDGKPCSSTVRLENIIDCRNNCAELNSTELDLVILGMIQSAINCDENGLTLRTHGNKKLLPSSAFSAETVERVVKFFMNVAEDQALLLPGRVPGFKRFDVKLMPSSLTKCKLWKMFQDACSAAGQVAVGYYKFCDLWNQLCPFIVIMRPASDLCWTCQKNYNKILKSPNLPESQKAEVVKEQEAHLRMAAGERDFLQKLL